jgi:hypothetical protein
MANFRHYNDPQCQHCIYLGSLTLSSTCRYDLYAHTENVRTVIARYGDNVDSYTSGAAIAKSLHLRLPHLDEDYQALRIAWLIATDQGLLSNAPQRATAQRDVTRFRAGHALVDNEYDDRWAQTDDCASLNDDDA